MKSVGMYIPQNISQLRDKLSSILLSAPKFEDKTGYLPGSDIDYAFRQLNGGLEANRHVLGEQRYLQLTRMSGQIRALFEADPDDKTGDTDRGCKIIHEMEEILQAAERRS